MSKFRVFISYSHEDNKLVKKLVKVLEKNGLTPMWDINLASGQGFSQQIKDLIAYAHVFIPFITKASSKRGWVHQEIGYATALNIPVLPITFHQFPGEMLQQLLAVQWTDDKESLMQKLSMQTFTDLVYHDQKNQHPLYESAELREDRTKMMVEYATKVSELKFYGQVRQKGALSSFHLPDKPMNHPIWKQMQGPIQISEYCWRLLREERRILERHARKSGCKIIIDPYLAYKNYGPEARKVRLETLLEFLESMPKRKIKVAINRRMQEAQNLTVVGDWFIAESVSVTLGMGYRQTIFTRHAPTVQSRIELFDKEFNELLREQGHSENSSRDAVLKEIRKIIKDLEKKVKIFPSKFRK